MAMDHSTHDQQLELPIHPESDLSGSRTYFTYLRESLLEPKALFLRLKGPLSIPFALFFAVSVHWAGAALEFVWKSSLGKLVENRTSFWMSALEKVFMETAETDRFPFEGLKEQFVRWIWGIGSVLIDPLKTLHQVVTLAFFVWVAGKIFNRLSREDLDTESRLSFPMALTLVCLAQGPSLLQGIPLYGAIVASTLSFIVLALGAQVTYRTSFLRAILIASFPSLIYYGSILLGLAVLAGFLFNFVSQIFWSL
jgi:hypothetical protein